MKSPFTYFTKGIFGIAFLFSLAATSSYSQIQHSYDVDKVCKLEELNFAHTDYRGIESRDEVIYYVENDLQTMTAYKNGGILWQVNIIEACGIPKDGKPAIRYFRLEPKKLHITYGKHRFAGVDFVDGKVTCLGLD